MNSLSISGRLTAPLDMKVAKNGNSYGDFSLAVDNPQDKDKTFFFNVRCFGANSEYLSKYASKGSRVGVEGNIESYSWEKDGERRSGVRILARRVEVLESKAESEARRAAGPSTPPMDASPFDDDEEQPF